MIWNLRKIAKKAGKELFTGVITAVNSIGNYDVKIMPRDHEISGIAFFGNVQLQVDDVVKIGYIDHDPQKPVILGFGNSANTNITIVDETETETTAFKKCLYYLHNWANTSMVTFTGSDLPQTLSGEIHHEFPTGEEPGFCDGNFIYGNKKSYSIDDNNNISEAIDYTSSDYFSDIPTLIQNPDKLSRYEQNILLYDAFFGETWVSHISGGYRYRAFATDNSPYRCQLLKDDLSTGGKTFSNTYYSAPGLWFGVLANETFGLVKLTKSGSTNTGSLGAWSDWNNPNLHSATKTGSRTYQTLYSVLKKANGIYTIDWIFADKGAWPYPTDQFYKTSGSWSQIMSGVDSGFNIAPDSMGNGNLFKREWSSGCPRKYNQNIPPTWATFEEEGNGSDYTLTGGTGWYYICNSTTRFSYLRSENRSTYFPAGQMKYFLLDYRLQIKSTKTVTLPFSSNDLELFAFDGDTLKQSQFENRVWRGYERNLFLITTDNFVYFPYEDRQNNKIGVLGIDTTNNEIVYHYQQDVVSSQWPGAFEQKLWCYGKFLAFNAGDCWKIIK